MRIHVVSLSLLITVAPSFSCTRMVRQESPARIVGDPKPSGKYVGPEDIDIVMEIDPDKLIATTLMQGSFRQVRKQEIRKYYQTCEKDGFLYKWLGYSLGGANTFFAGIFTGIGASEGVDSATFIGSICWLGVASGTIITTLVVDSMHDDDEVFNCSEEEKYSRTYKKILGDPVVRGISEYRVVVVAGKGKRTFKPEQDGTARIDLAGLVDRCPSSVLWKSTYDDPALSGISRFIRSSRIGVAMVQKRKVLKKEIVKARTLDLRSYLAHKASRIGVEAERGPSLLPVSFVIEDKNTRVPVRGAEIRVRVTKEPRREPSVKITPEAKAFAAHLEHLPCNAPGMFFDFVRDEVRRTRSALEPSEVPSCRFEEGECNVRSDARGRIQIVFFPNTEVHLEIRHDNYYFQSLDLKVGAEKPRWTTSQKNKIKPNQYGPGYIILLQDVGQRIRRGD